eukprot:gene2731-biopygen9608
MTAQSSADLATAVPPEALPTNFRATGTFLPPEMHAGKPLPCLPGVALAISNNRSALQLKKLSSCFAALLG